MNKETAHEFTEALDQTASGLGQATTGWWRQVATGVRLNVPDELGQPRDKWTEGRRDAFGNMLLRAPERQEAVAELTAPVENGGEGLNNSEAADVLGVDEGTVRKDRKKNGSENSEPTQRDLPMEAEPEPDDSENSASEPKPKIATFNRVNDNIGWAKWSWNPVTGCLHNCPYCYARDIANRFYPQKFEPTFHPERLTAPQNTKLPAASDQEPAWRRVFTCSMADLFGKWVPQEWIDAVFEQIVAAPQWEFLCLTKFPQRLATFDWPDNVWTGTTVDRQHRVDLAQRHFAEVKAGVRWLSCEPLLEPLRFDSLEMFDWVVIGACTASAGAPEFAPPFDWVVDLYQQARDAGCRVYLKHNLFAGGVAPGMEPIHEWPR